MIIRRYDMQKWLCRQLGRQDLLDLLDQDNEHEFRLQYREMIIAIYNGEIII